jgi:hypothetical protein
VRAVLEIDLALWGMIACLAIKLRNTLFRTECLPSTKWPPRLIQPANLLLQVPSRLAKHRQYTDLASSSNRYRCLRFLD